MMAAATSSIRQCATCGESLDGLNARARYCSADCRAEAKRKRDRRAKADKRAGVVKTDRARARTFGSLSEDQVLDAIAQGLGIKTSIAKRLGISRALLDRWIKENPTVAAAFDEAVEILIDTAEHKLMEQVLGGDMRAIKYLLDTKGKTRGYGQPNRLLVGVSQLTPEERASRFARVARAFGHELPPGGLEGVIDVSAVEDDD